MNERSFSTLLSASAVVCRALLLWGHATASPRTNQTKATSRVWPGATGEATVCLWADDKLAAFSIPIDDNSNPDVAWLLEKSKKMQRSLTWFITCRVGTGDFWGTWDRRKQTGESSAKHA